MRQQQGKKRNMGEFHSLPLSGGGASSAASGRERGKRACSLKISVSSKKKKKEEGLCQLPKDPCWSSVCRGREKGRRDYPHSVSEKKGKEGGGEKNPSDFLGGNSMFFYYSGVKRRGQLQSFSLFP